MKSNIFFTIGESYADKKSLFEWRFCRHDPCSRPNKPSGGFICGFQTVIKIRFWVFSMNAYLWERDLDWSRDFRKAAT